tara:strand:- start:41 stop:844 length:804 start_codon:yes stop_codon:yes gene_type:complete
MTYQFINNDHGRFACSHYGPEWAGPDGDRLTLAIGLLQDTPSEQINIDFFVQHLEFEPSIEVKSIIEAATTWTVNEEATTFLHAHKDKYIVALTTSNTLSKYPAFQAKAYDAEVQEKLSVAWKKEVFGVSQGAYVSQAQHIVASGSRLGMKAQVDENRLIWPPRQLNSTAQRIENAQERLSETATILTWTRLSSAGAPSEFSERAPILGGVSTVLVSFDKGPQGVFMLADDDENTPKIEDTVRFEIRRLYGQDGMIHYGTKAILNNF